MAGPGIIAGSEQRIKISDTFLNANAGDSSVIIDIINLDPVAAFQKDSTRLPNAGRMGKFEPRGVSCDGAKSGGSTDLTAASGIINASEKSEQHFLQQRYNCGMIHAARITEIKPFGTTARGIIIHG